MNRNVISIHAPHAGRDGLIYSNMGIGYISIHAPHAGRDVPQTWYDYNDDGISIHAPHAGRDESLEGV